MKVHNFSPGPSILPDVVLQQTQEALVNFGGLNLSVAEISHRHPKMISVVEEATQLVKELYGLGNDFEVIWLPGGASSQLAIAPMNLVPANRSIAMVDSGFWANKAIEAALQLTKVNVLASAKNTNYDRLPEVRSDLEDAWLLPSGTQYVHLVSNETIDGCQYQSYPNVSVPIVADMTSDIFSRPIPAHKFGLIFASAQKNFGIAGITCVIIRKGILLSAPNKNIPKIFDYATHIAEGSLYHTLPTLPMYVSLLALRWTKAQGGVAVMQQQNETKAHLLYNEIENNPLFVASVVPKDRSMMSVCFRAINHQVENSFLAFAEQNGIHGIKGFPTVGGFRASLYNAMPLQSVQYLIQLMKNFNL